LRLWRPEMDGNLTKISWGFLRHGAMNPQLDVRPSLIQARDSDVKPRRVVSGAVR
jgi:hypothetical protein